MRITVAAGGVKAQGRHPVGFGRVNRFAFDLQVVEYPVLRHKADVGELRIGTGVRLHLCYRSQVIRHLFAAHIDIHQHIAERLHLQDIFIGDITAFNGVADPAAAHHRKIGVSTRHLRCQHQVPHVGLHETHLTAIPFQPAGECTDLHIQLGFAFILERRQQGEHLWVFRNFRGIEDALALAVIVGHLLLQVDRDQLIMHQLHLPVTEFEIRAADVFTPLMGLHNPDAVLLVRRARRARHIVHLFFIF